MAQQPEDAKLEDFFKKYLEESFHQRPLEASRLGDHRFDNLLDDISPKAREGWITHTRNTLTSLGSTVAYDKLSRDGQIDYEIFQNDLQRRIWLDENMHPFEEDPRTYGEYINDATYILLTSSTLPKESNISNCIARMAEMPRIVAAAKETLKNPAKPILDTAIRQNRGAISFYEKEIFELAGDTPQLDRLKAAAAPVAELLKDYQKFLETDLTAHATGEWRIGKDKFYQKLVLETDAGMDADQALRRRCKLNSIAWCATCMSFRASCGSGIFRARCRRRTIPKAGAK